MAGPEPRPCMTPSPPPSSSSFRPLVLIGSGGHAREVAEIAEHAHLMGQGGPVLGYLDEDAERHGSEVLGYPVLGGMDWLAERRNEVEVLIAIGKASIRRRIAEQLGAQTRYATVISPLAHLSKHCQIGEGTVVFPMVVVSNLAQVGKHVQLNTACSLSHDAEVGDYCSIFPGALITGGAKLGEEVTLGTNASVIPYKSIGSGTEVGAGACVVNDLPGGVTAVGVPAKQR